MICMGNIFIAIRSIDAMIQRGYTKTMSDDSKSWSVRPYKLTFYMAEQNLYQTKFSAI